LAFWNAQLKVNWIFEADLWNFFGDDIWSGWLNFRNPRMESAS